MGLNSLAGLSGLSGLVRGYTYSDKILGYGPFAYFTLSDKVGLVARDLTVNANHGTYFGVTLGQPGIGDGRTSPYFDNIP